MEKCKCEHSGHFGDKTPNGNPGHKYEASFMPSFLVAVHSPYGDFIVCKDCAKDCYQDCPEIGK